MPTDMTVVIADATQTPAIRAGLPLSGRVAWYTDTNLAMALTSFQLNHPRVIAVEAALAQKPHGQAFLTRIEQMSIPGTTIALVVRTNGKWLTTPHIARQAPEESQTTASGNAGRPASVAVQPNASNTRRSKRFKVLESLNATLESGQAELVNVSICGAQVVSKPAVYPTQTIKIVLPDGDHTLRLTARVAWSAFEQIPQGTDAHYRAGVAFVDAAQEILEDYCRRHCASEPLASH